MADITLEQISKTLKLDPKRLLAYLKEAGITDKNAQSTLSKAEKQTLTQYLRSKRQSHKKPLTKKTLVAKSHSDSANTAAAAIQIKHKKPLKSKDINEKAKEKDAQTQETYQKSIKESNVLAKKQSEQEQKRQGLMRKKVEDEKVTQQEKQRTNDQQVARQEKTKQTTKSEPTTADSKKRVVVIDNNKTQKVSQYKVDLNASRHRKLKKKDKTKLSQKLREEQAKQHQFIKPVAKVIYEISIPEVIQVSELAEKMKIKAAEVLKQMMAMGVRATINDNIDQDTAMLVVEEMGHKAIVQEASSIEDVVLSESSDVSNEKKLPRAPIVAVMGHVDHGKTSLLDYIRHAAVAEKEVGGITQHIGAYQVHGKNGNITFLDTPGHSAFTQMRFRGANATDIVILVVAADDGVMPETIDSIKHAKTAKTAIIVAINKIDKEAANPEKVRQMLSSHDVIDESWGGDTMMVEVSANTGQGIDELLEAISLQAEILELSAVVDARAKGVVLESRIEKGRGKIATLLVQEGTLKVGDIIVAGQQYGKVKKLLDDNGRIVKKAVPSTPVEMLGLSGVPEAGDTFVVLDSERKAKEIADYRQHKNKELRLQKQQVVKVENLMTQMQKPPEQKINILLKTDVQGSSQAIAQALEKLSNDTVSINIISTGVGAINDTDMALAVAATAIVLGFGVRADAVAKKTAERENIDIRYYSIIYNLIDDVKAMMSGVLAPELSEEIIGLAEVKEVFKSKKIGDIAGCIVIEGKVRHNNPIRILRDNVVIYEGELESLRRFKDEVNEVASGTECGIGVKDYNNIKVGDQIEVFIRVETPAKQ